MVAVGRLLISVGNLLKNDSAEEAIKEAVCKLSCLTLERDWIIFNYPPHLKIQPGEVILKVFLEIDPKEDKIGLLGHKMAEQISGIEREVKTAIQPFVNGQHITVEAVLTNAGLDEHCLGV